MHFGKLCRNILISCMLFDSTQSRTLTLRSSKDIIPDQIPSLVVRQDLAQSSGATASDEVEVEFANPDISVPDPVHDSNTINGPSKPFNPLIQPAANSGATKTGNEKKKKREEVDDPDNAWYTISEKFQDFGGAEVIPSDVIPAGSMQPFIVKAKDYAQKADQSYRGLNLTFADNDWSLRMRVVGNPPNIDGWRPLWQIYADICVAILEEITDHPDINKTISGYGLTNGKRNVDYSLVHTFGVIDKIIPKRKRNLRHENQMPSLETRTSTFVIDKVGSGLQKRSQFVFNNLRFTLYFSSVRRAHGELAGLASIFLSQMEQQSTQYKIWYDGMKVGFPANIIYGGSASDALQAHPGHQGVANFVASPFLQIVAAAGTRFDWGTLIEIATYFHAKALRMQWQIKAGTHQALGGLIYEGAALLGAWSWGLDVHTFLQEQVVRNNQEIVNAMQNIPNFACPLLGYGCYERQVQLP